MSKYEKEKEVGIYFLEVPFTLITLKLQYTELK